jgi:hypothetical protein
MRTLIVAVISPSLSFGINLEKEALFSGLSVGFCLDLLSARRDRGC